MVLIFRVLRVFVLAFVKVLCNLVFFVFKLVCDVVIFMDFFKV